MFEIVEEKKDSILIEVDKETFQSLSWEIDEDFSKYEFVFDEPTPTSELIK